MISGELWGKDQGWASLYKGRNSSAARRSRSRWRRAVVAWHRRDGLGIWLRQRATTTMHLA